MDIRKSLLILSITVLSLASAVDLSSDCGNSENPILCRSANFLAKALNQVVTSQDDETLRLLPGLEIVQNENINKIYHENDERSMDDEKSDTFFMRIAKYLQTHDLKIKFSDIVAKKDLQEIVNNVFNSDDPAIVEARKKDKGGGMMLMAMMMGKMLASMGLAGVGALAAKALGVSMMALMLAGIVGLKKLADGGGDGGHSVHYVSAGGDHHRRRRFVHREHDSAPLPYRGYDIH